MEFRNLTPFDALAYSGIDTQDREYHVVALSVGYQLVRTYPDATAFDPKSEVFTARVIDDVPLALCLADEHWAEPSTSSLRCESDLVPYKPKCDVLVTGHAYAQHSSHIFEASLRLSQAGKTLIDKALSITGARRFERQGGLGGWLREGVNPTRAYDITVSQACTQVPLRYELAYGGASVVANPKRKADTDPEHLMNEVCYRNPVGAGWMAKGYFEALAQTPQGLPTTLRAPQILTQNTDLRHLIQTEQSANMDARQMAQLDYKIAVAGFGPLCKAWAPRLAKAGTYDQAWLDKRHPYLPKDFDFGYWNGAPEDQQIAFPDLTQGLLLQTEGLRPGGKPMQVQLPGHRAFVLLRFADGVMLPHPMWIDTLVLHTDGEQGPCLRLVWRTRFPDQADLALRVMEARFEVNPQTPLLKLQGVNA